jgi:hypothetical protein
VKLYVGITDYDWFKLHASKESLGEVNFWRPSHQPYRKDFQPGMPFLFKLHAPENAIVGGGFFLKFLALPLSLAWGTLGEPTAQEHLKNFAHNDQQASQSSQSSPMRILSLAARFWVNHSSSTNLIGCRARGMSSQRPCRAKAISIATPRWNSGGKLRPV